MAHLQLRVLIHDNHGREPTGMVQSSSWECCILIHRQQEKRDTGPSTDGFLKPQRSPQGHTSFNKITPPDLFQTVSLTGNQLFKHMSLWRLFSFKPPQCFQTSKSPHFCYYCRSLLYLLLFLQTCFTHKRPHYLYSFPSNYPSEHPSHSPYAQQHLTEVSLPFFFSLEEFDTLIIILFYNKPLLHFLWLIHAVSLLLLPWLTTPPQSCLLLCNAQHFHPAVPTKYLQCSLWATFNGRRILPRPSLHP